MSGARRSQAEEQTAALVAIASILAGQAGMPGAAAILAFGSAAGFIHSHMLYRAERWVLDRAATIGALRSFARAAGDFDGYHRDVLVKVECSVRELRAVRDAIEDLDGLA